MLRRKEQIRGRRGGEDGFAGFCTWLWGLLCDCLLGLPLLHAVLLCSVEVLELVLEGQICKEMKAWNPEFKPNTGSQ